MNIIIGIIIGYIIATIIVRKKTVGKKLQAVRFSIGDHYLRIHYWVLGLLFILIFGSLVLKWNVNLLFGFSAGIVIQGLSYYDYLLVWYKKKDEEKINDKYKKQKLKKEREDKK